MYSSQKPRYEPPDVPPHKVLRRDRKLIPQKKNAHIVAARERAFAERIERHGLNLKADLRKPKLDREGTTA